ncbi:MAG: magnesium-translocating P-type ATPase [Nitrosomonas sp.]|nr:MAG: magnesium-translocating P-type ATPase [Nitrosomonas sp.]
MTSDSAAERLRQFGKNILMPGRRHSNQSRLFLNQFGNPLVLILIFAAVVAILVQDWLDALIVLTIILISALLGYMQEFRAMHAIERLQRQISIKTTVVRDGRLYRIGVAEVVPGDIVVLAAGNLIPADGVLLESKDFYVSQALLTGETFPVPKNPGIAAEHASLVERNNCVFMGTSVRSGTAKVLIVRTGLDTYYGKIAERLALRSPETEFERGLRQFGVLLVRVMVVVVAVVLIVNIALQHPTIEAVMFALALAVGLSPELLPAILTITLAHGAKSMASHGVIVKRLNAIENLGSMDVLCTDKTGTLTEGVVQLDSALDSSGQASQSVLQFAFLNARYQTGLSNTLDDAIIAAGVRSGLAESPYHILDEMPYDFVRKRLSIVVRHETETTAILISKGALEPILAVCDRVQTDGGVEALSEYRQQSIRHQFAAWSAQGYRVLGVAQKSIAPAREYTRDDERDLIFVGFLLFFDPPKADVNDTLCALRKLGVKLKIITGDNRFVARHVAEMVGIDGQCIITGAELDDMKDEALWHLVSEVTLFAEVDPNQKERIITALQKNGCVVGYLGDGINDAPALHAADVGISVDQAADAAKEAADLVLLQHDLAVLRRGIEEGRHTFANTLKYIFITTSANFGNMISMALASLFLPFLPMLAKQILLNNFLSDIPAIGIAGDNVERDWQRTPHRWNIQLIRNFMITFGLVSVIFDLLTFGVLLYFAGEVAAIFRTGWFVESLLTELLVLLVIRTYKPFYRSRPGKFLMAGILGVSVVALVLPYSPLGAAFDFVPLPWPLLGAILAITGLYVGVTEIVKRYFFRHWDRLR